MAIVVTASLDECGKNATTSGGRPVAGQPQFDGFLTGLSLKSKQQNIENEVVSCDVAGWYLMAAPLLSCYRLSQRP